MRFVWSKSGVFVSELITYCSISIMSLYLAIIALEESPLLFFLASVTSSATCASGALVYWRYISAKLILARAGVKYEFVQEDRLSINNDPILLTIRFLDEADSAFVRIRVGLLRRSFEWYDLDKSCFVVNYSSNELNIQLDSVEFADWISRTFECPKYERVRISMEHSIPIGIRRRLECAFIHDVEYRS